MFGLGLDGLFGCIRLMTFLPLLVAARSNAFEP
jgi:hypothetical protein